MALENPRIQCFSSSCKLRVPVIIEWKNFIYGHEIKIWPISACSPYLKQCASKGRFFILAIIHRVSKIQYMILKFISRNLVYLQLWIVLWKAYCCSSKSIFRPNDSSHPERFTTILHSTRSSFFAIWDRWCGKAPSQIKHLRCGFSFDCKAEQIRKKSSVMPNCWALYWILQRSIILPFVGISPIWTIPSVMRYQGKVPWPIHSWVYLHRHRADSSMHNCAESVDKKVRFAESDALNMQSSPEWFAQV